MDIQWQNFLTEEMAKPYFKELIAFIKQERLTKKVIPAPENVFEAFNLCPFHELSTVLYDYEPDIQPNANHGIAYSSKLETRSTAIRNILCEASRQPEFYMDKIYPHNDLSFWAKQGILMLNFNMTGVESVEYAHASKGWTEFQTNLVKFLNTHKNRLTFMLWGKPIIDNIKPVIDSSRHLILEAGHPAKDPLYDWAYNCHFLKASLFSQFESRILPGEDVTNIRVDMSIEEVNMGGRINWGLQ